MNKKKKNARITNKPKSDRAVTDPWAQLTRTTLYITRFHLCSFSLNFFFFLNLLLNCRHPLRVPAASASSMLFSTLYVIYSLLHHHPKHPSSPRSWPSWPSPPWPGQLSPPPWTLPHSPASWHHTHPENIHLLQNHHHTMFIFLPLLCSRFHCFFLTFLFVSFFLF